MIQNQKKIVSVALPIDVYEKIDSLAQDCYRTRAGYIRQIIKLYLRHLEEHEAPAEWWIIK